ncbi:hypothetical protein NQ317_010909 [Molorchus minor]|uniref:Uncharacterized protein n=1 Tax=Molorchus minor TaxID=1323400 RepID=A0ABQ9J889_9CUCU|nr:hypothetical protein NQ317_010909 [Molorchus minor]
MNDICYFAQSSPNSRQYPLDLKVRSFFRLMGPVIVASPGRYSRIQFTTHWVDGLTSRLHLTYAHLSDSGNYSCVPTIAQATSVNVHVINGEHPAAMQHGNKNTASISPSLHGVLVYTLIAFIIKTIR